MVQSWGFLFGPSVPTPQRFCDRGHLLAGKGLLWVFSGKLQGHPNWKQGCASSQPAISPGRKGNVRSLMEAVTIKPAGAVNSIHGCTESDSHYKVPQTGWLKQQTFIFSLLWRLEVQEQGTTGVGSWRESSSWLADGHPLTISSHGLPFMHVWGKSERWCNASS